MSEERVAVVTGANKGIGYGIVKALIQEFDGIIYLTARDETRGQEALQSLKQMKECKYPEKLRFHKLDILDPNSIKAFHDHIKSNHTGLNIIVNNAAIAFKVESSEPFGDQARVSMATNYHALLNLSNVLYPLLRSSGRVVNLSSSCGHLCHVKSETLKRTLLEDVKTVEQLTDLMEQFVELAEAGTHSDKGWPNSAYGVTKIGVTKLSFLQHQLLSQDTTREDLVVNCVHPGYCNTDMSNGKGPLTIEQGARSAVYCALLPPNVQSPRGQFVWDDCQVIDWTSAQRPPCLSDKITVSQQ
uniref:carbonyl reductase (NADPH) n=1 Tax=Cacopsylla melanoneura TaxID=428564 RepID=A0A8D8LDN9_9HEMI